MYDDWKLQDGEPIYTSDDIDRDAECECETCEGSGTVTIENVWTVDGGTKWARYYRENLLDECPECDGAGFLIRK